MSRLSFDGIFKGLKHSLDSFNRKSEYQSRQVVNNYYDSSSGPFYAIFTIIKDFYIGLFMFLSYCISFVVVYWFLIFIMPFLKCMYFFQNDLLLGIIFLFLWISSTYIFAKPIVRRFYAVIPLKIVSAITYFILFYFTFILLWTRIIDFQC